MIAPLHVRPWSVTRADAEAEARGQCIAANLLARLAELQLERMRTAEGLDLASAWARFLGECDDN